MLRSGSYIFLYIIGFAAATVFGIIFFFKTDPESATQLQRVLAYGVVFVWTASAATLCGYFIRTFLWRNRPKNELFQAARRQGIILAVFATSLVIMQNFGVLTVRNGILLLALFILLEVYSY